ncbi:HNH endonuclease [Eubacterium callanderi]|uniref:HNH endonuclease n=1 Tax=Eubacterium callanderi TaxID=53442 RepID=UPI001AA1D28A|nr:HNH endonuclease [Eubacterium callanderi]MBO1703590.1 hypothetical protein [Eubacterium callanderi]MDR4073864.1 HNH endonuclease [Eubacterium sp.]
MNKVILDEERLRFLYLEKGLSMKEIADQLSISIGTVFNRCKQYGIETREHSEVFTFKGKKHTAKVCRIISKTHKGKVLSDDTRKKISDAHFRGGIGHKKKRSDGYIAVYMPEHPKSTKEGYIMEHDLIMECSIGRWLAENEVVHHKNEQRDDNRLQNLELMTASDHMSYHSRKRNQEKRKKA